MIQIDKLQNTTPKHRMAPKKPVQSLQGLIFQQLLRKRKEITQASEPERGVNMANVVDMVDIVK